MKKPTKKKSPQLKAQGLWDAITTFNKDMATKISALFKHVSKDQIEGFAKAAASCLEVRADGSVWIVIKIHDADQQVQSAIKSV